MNEFSLTVPRAIEPVIRRLDIMEIQLSEQLDAAGFGPQAESLSSRHRLAWLALSAALATLVASAIAYVTH